LGLELANPLVASAGPLTGTVDSIRRLEENGIAAIVFPSLFEEQIEHEEMEIQRLYEYQTDAFAEALSFFPEMNSYNTGPDAYLEKVREAKAALSIPVIASLNGTTQGGWTKFARQIQDAGADALELNVYFVPTDVEASPLEVEVRYTELVKSVRDTVSIPLAVKIGPFFNSIPYMAKRLQEAGADGIVLFNRYLEPDIDIDSLSIEPRLVLSDPRELYLPLRWIAILKGHITSSLAATSGVHECPDVIKALLAGADVAMMASVLLKRGPSHVSSVLSQLHDWMSEHEYSSVNQMKGSMSRENCPDPSSLERANYTQALVSYTDKYLAGPA
ncbi:MAG: dihydroorotate dehydrogenase-like protein, partial [Planctomycetales bacterium]|nr:dihydroorotate dehydrogenase-like protein [Planctomycetales bacterium]